MKAAYRYANYDIRVEDVPKPVSYTHLDVYKRQRSSCVASAMTSVLSSISAIVPCLSSPAAYASELSLIHI